MTNEIDQTKVEALATKAEEGKSLSEDLNSMTWQDRAAYVRAMDKVNEEHRKNDPNLPDLQIDWGKGAEAQEHVMDIEMSNHFYTNDEDVYDLPAGNMFTENYAVAADTAHSTALRSNQMAESIR